MYWFGLVPCVTGIKNKVPAPNKNGMLVIQVIFEKNDEYSILIY